MSLNALYLPNKLGSVVYFTSASYNEEVQMQMRLHLCSITVENVTILRALL